MLSKHYICVAVMCFLVHPTSAQTLKFIENPTIYISGKADLKVNQDAQMTFESFVRNWSQFEILVDKKLFPIEAPNCKETVQIRFKGIEPVKEQSTPIQKSRWELLQRIRKGNRQDAAPIFLHIDTNQYMKKASNGKYVLDYCNVFVE